jgi:NTE family protein
MAVRRINLALQGGGAYGAFTWGVLDRLLCEDDIEIAAISGTSAGALNGAAVKSGLARGGRAAARENLDWLWEQVGAVGDMRLAEWFRAFLPLAGIWSGLTERLAPFSPVDVASRVFSPYDLGPLYRNPLDRVARAFEFKDVRGAPGPDLFVAATNVRTGKIRVFPSREITPEVILASACLPAVFQAVEIEDPETGRMEAYWDGGYTGNPALFPLFHHHLPRDVVVVSINPLVHDSVPMTATEIQDRISEISFNASLLAELRAINFVKRLIATGVMRDDAMKDVLVHIIADDGLMNTLCATSKVTPTPGLLFALKEAGIAAADRFLAEHGQKLNHEASADLPRMFG